MRPGHPDPSQAARYVRCVRSLTGTGLARAHPPGALPHAAGPHGPPSLHPWGPAHSRPRLRASKRPPGASYDPGVLKGLAWSRIATDLHDPSTAVAKSALGAANYITAALCKLTGDKPATACTPAVQALQSRI